MGQKAIDVTEASNQKAASRNFNHFISPTFDINKFISRDDATSEISERSATSDDHIQHAPLTSNKTFKEFITALKESSPMNGNNKEKRRSFSFLNDKNIATLEQVTGVTMLHKGDDITTMQQNDI